MDGTLTYGTWVRRRRRDLDLTQSELARRVCCALTTIEKLEADARRPSKAMAERLADALLLAPDARPGFLNGARSGWMGEEVGMRAGSAPVERSALGGTLPAPLTPLIGRAREVAAVCAALETTAVRVLTLTGPGGTGKTRLALQVAAELELAFADGVVFVDLAPIRDPTLVITTIAAALRLPDVGGQPLLARLQAALRERQLLLLLDNFEQVLPAAPLVAELLTTAPHVKVLFTSRVLVGVYGEHTVPVPPMTLPDLSDLPLLDRLGQVETVQLFVERAQAATPDFCLTSENAHVVSDICHELDGLPLSIELAAARVRRLSPQALLERFRAGKAGRLQALTGGPRTVPARQQTVRATIAWSYDLLNAREQRLLRRLGVFVGGCTLEAAEHVCGWEDEGQVLDALESLLDNSLVQCESVDDTARFTMLETIREYALEQLVEHGELEDLQGRHADYFVTLAERVHPVVAGQRRRWWERLDAEHDNFRAVLGWSRTAASSEMGLRLTVALTAFWQFRGHMAEGYGWLAGAVMQHEGGVPSKLSPEEYQRLRAYALDALGRFALFLGDADRVQAVFEESLALFQNLDDRAGRIEVLSDLGMLFAMRGDFVQSQACLDERLRLARAFGQASLIANSLFFLGLLAYGQGQSRRAGELWEEGLLHLGVQEDPLQWAQHLAYLSMVALDQGDYGRAGEQLAESLTLLRELGERWETMILVLELCARLVVEQRHAAEGVKRGVVQAAWLFGAAEALRETLGVQRLAMFDEHYQRSLAAARANLDTESFATAWAEGRALSLEQAVVWAFAAAASSKQD